MKIKPVTASLVIAILQSLAVKAQSAPATTPAPASLPSTLSPAAVEVAKLAQAGADDEVVRAFIGQSQSYYNLTAADIAALMKLGVSAGATTAMLKHDTTLRAQQAAAPAPQPMPAVAANPVASGSAPATITTGPTTNFMAVQPAQPPPQPEVIPPTPSPDYVWAPGYWSWNGGTWIWIGGYWRYPARPGRVWVGGYWSGHGWGRVWVSGHWR
jgi:hypothetical protein